MLRMDDAKASEAARELVRHRWGNQVLTRAVGVVVERAADLDEPLREQLRQVTERKTEAINGG
jgi:hypothetical protein